MASTINPLPQPMQINKASAAATENEKSELESRSLAPAGNIRSAQPIDRQTAKQQTTRTTGHTRVLTYRMHAAC